MIQVGSCPHCGAPIYAPSPWNGVTPPPPQYTCACVAHPIVTTASTTRVEVNTGGKHEG